jgi:hypothetical protein
MTIYTQERIQNELAAFCGNLMFPNTILPAEFQDGRTGYVAGETLVAKCNERDRLESDHVIEKREKARRVELYREQLESGKVLTDNNPTFNYLQK